MFFKKYIEMHKLNLNSYKTSPEDVTPKWRIYKCTGCNFQVLRILKDDIVEFKTNLHEHASHDPIRVNLKQSIAKKVNMGMSKYVKALITPLVETGVKNVKIMNHLRGEAKLAEDLMPSAAQLNRFRWYYRATKINEIGVKLKSSYIEWIDKKKLTTSR